MEITTIILLILTFFAVLILIFRQKQPQGLVSQNIALQLQQIREEITRTSAESNKNAQYKLDRLMDQITKGSSQSHSTIQRQFEQTSKIIQSVTEKLSSLDNTNKQVLDFSHQLNELQNILRNPKQRGVLGEYWLETLLNNVLPKGSYELQYNLGENEKGEKLIPDAIIMVRDQIIPIDAKFSLENYNRMISEPDQIKQKTLEKTFKNDIKMRIDETSKYIRPEYNTMGFSFMFIPAEGVYNSLLSTEIGIGSAGRNLIEYAFSKHVMIVSPTSFYAYLQTVLMGLRELQLEESTHKIIKRVGELNKHFEAYSEYHQKLGNNLKTVVNQYNQTNKELKKVTKDIVKLTDGDKSDIIDIENIETPSID